MTAAQSLINLPALTAEQAEHWIAASLAESRALRQHDEQLYPTSDEANTMRAAEALHTAWRHWADDAETLLERIRPLLSAKCHIAGSRDLDYEIGRVRAMLRLDPATMLVREAQARLGNVLSIEETRRELRSTDRP
jgi:hypothetical protein